MRARTVRDLGALVRVTRRARGLTQAELASRLGVSRDWVVRLERGHPRLEAQKVLDALTVLQMEVDVRDGADTSRRPTRTGVGSPTDADGPTGPAEADPFDVLFEDR